MTQQRDVVRSVEILTSTDHIRRALTQPDMIMQWMGGTHVESTWEIGSNISLTGTMPNFNRRYRDRGKVIGAK